MGGGVGSSVITLCVAFCPSAITQQQVVHGNCGLCAAAEECVSEIRILLEHSHTHTPATVSTMAWRN